MGTLVFAVFWHVKACVMGQCEHLQAVTWGQVTQWGQALAQGFGWSGSGMGWGRVPPQLLTGNKDASAASGASTALGGKAWLSLPRLKPKGPAMAVGLGDFIPSSPCNFFLPASRDCSRLNK